VRPNARGSVPSRPIANIVRVTWISVVSRVAMVDSTTAMDRILPPGPGQMAWPSRSSRLPLLPVTVSADSSRFTSTVKHRNRPNTITTPTMPPRPAARRADRVSSFRLADTSQPQ